MTGPEVDQLLAVIMSYDNRDAGDSVRLGWAEAASRGRWTRDEAIEAVHAHYAERAEWCMPAHVTGRIRAARQDVAMRSPVAPSLSSDPASRGLPAGVDPDDGRTNSVELERLHRAAILFPCRGCSAPPAVRCTNPVSGVATKIPHALRLVDARQNGVDLGCGTCDAGPGERCGPQDRHGQCAAHLRGQSRVRPELAP